MGEAMRTGPDPRTDDELEAVRDDDIVRRAQLWATGATIHDVNQMTGNYCSQCQALDCIAKTGVGDRRGFLEWMAWSREVLEEFMRCGNFRKAREKYPMPRIESKGRVT